MRFFIIASFAVLLFSCRRNTDTGSSVDPNNLGILKNITFKVDATPYANQSTFSSHFENKINDLHGYVFIDGILKQVYKDLEKGNLQNITITTYSLSNAKCYFVANTSLFSNFHSLMQLNKTTLADFENLRTDLAQTLTPQQLLMSSGIALSGENKTLNVSLERSIARVDLTITEPNVEISRIIIKNLSTGTYIVGKTRSTPNYGTLFSKDTTFAIPLKTTLNGFAYINEQQESQISLELFGKFDGQSVSLKTTLPKTIARNTLYEVKILKIGTSLTAVVSIADWRNGESSTATPDITKSPKVDRLNSIFPSGVLIASSNDTILIPKEGASFTLGIESDYEVTLTPEGNRDALTITPVVGNGRKFMVTVSGQSPGNHGYLSYLNVKNKSLMDFYGDRIVLKIAPNYDVPIVDMGGLTWMAVNTQGKNIQIYPDAIDNIEQLYLTKWQYSLGNYYQWGRPTSYIPWESHSRHNIESMNNPWKDTSHMPCPPGFRVPTKEEMERIFPNNFTVPGQYTYNGETVDISLEEPANINLILNNGGTRNVKPRYLVLHNQTSGNKMYLPLAGYKGDKNMNPGSDIGNVMKLWYTSSTNFQSGIGGHAKCINFSGTAATKQITYSDFQMDAFATVRCVKNY